MAATFACNKCGYSQLTDAKHIGESFSCPQCGNVALVIEGAAPRTPPPVFRPDGKRGRLDEEALARISRGEMTFALQYVSCDETPSSRGDIDIPALRASCRPIVFESDREARRWLDLGNAANFDIAEVAVYANARKVFVALSFQCKHCLETSATKESATWALSRNAELFVRAGTEHLVPYHVAHGRNVATAVAGTP